MTPEQIKKKVLKYKWEYWVERPFFAFKLSLFSQGLTREYMLKTGVDAEWPATLFQNGAWYKSEEVWDSVAEQLRENISKGVSLFDVARSCEEFYEISKKEIKSLIANRLPPLGKLERLRAVFHQNLAYIWLAHGFEHVYIKELQHEVPKYYKGDVDKFIGDISFPAKKNAHTLMVDALMSDEDIQSIENKFAWIKSRDGFSPGFTVEELELERARLRQKKDEVRFKRPDVPRELRDLVAIAQELVYYRTFRTDILYEFMYLARPILSEVGSLYGLTFEALKHYSIYDLLSGKPRRFPETVCLATYGSEWALFDGPLFETEHSLQQELRGVIAYKGKVQGRAKIVKVAQDIGKVEQGDIIIAPTTAPSFIIGMQKAAGFVTEEGGITSHAAIVAREMKKPCIIGTKIATKVLKDGDFVEVDADNGIVKIIKKANG